MPKAQLAKAHGEHMVNPWLGPAGQSTWQAHGWYLGCVITKKAETKLIFPTKT